MIEEIKREMRLINESNRGSKIDSSPQIMPSSDYITSESDLNSI